jgi:hypothetical protein
MSMSDRLSAEKKKLLPFANAPRLAFSIHEFCALHRISRGYFYKLLRIGLAPRVMTVGGRKLISHEAATDWRREREAAAEKDAA